MGCGKIQEDCLSTNYMVWLKIEASRSAFKSHKAKVLKLQQSAVEKLEPDHEYFKSFGPSMTLDPSEAVRDGFRSTFLPANYYYNAYLTDDVLTEVRKDPLVESVEQGVIYLD